MTKFGTIQIKERDGCKRFIGLNEISYTKYNRPYWTIFKNDNTFLTFKNTSLIRGLQHLQSKLEDHNQ